MPRYFFDTYDQDELNRDDEGLECNVKAEIQERAIDALPDMAREALPDGPNHDFRVQVRNENDRVVFQATLVLRSEWLEDGPDF
ncbi:MAG: DUF6894 family protein [Mesorhizobium sp.]